MSASAIGVDIGGTNLRAGRVSPSGEVLARRAEPIVRDAEAVLTRIVALCRDLDDGTVAGVGVGVPGRVDARTATILSGGYLDLQGLALGERLAAALRRRVAIDNDCNAALVAEMAAGAARGCKSVVMFTVGTGIGGAIAQDGHILHGHRTAGQLGHVTVLHDGRACVCGRRGCVETMSSGTALGRLIAEADFPPGTLIDRLFEEAAAGEGRAARVLDAWALPLRAAIDSMVAAFDPELVVLGGGLGTAACRALERAPALSPWYQCPVVAANLGDDAGMVGSALRVMTGNAAEAASPPATLAHGGARATL